MSDVYAGPAGIRGQVRRRRVGFAHYEFSVCLGGRTWTAPERSRSRFVGRAAARRLMATPNRATRRAITVLNKQATT